MARNSLTAWLSGGRFIELKTAQIMAESDIPRLICEEDGLRVIGSETLEGTQSHQILHVEDFCNECGNCATVCVRNGQP